MIINNNYEELMIDKHSGRKFLRKLSKQEIFDVIDNKYTDEQATEKLAAMEQAGLQLDEIFNFALATTRGNTMKYYIPEGQYYVTIAHETLRDSHANVILFDTYSEAQHWIINHCDLSDKGLEIREVTR